jgi:hypothetical protein
MENGLISHVHVGGFLYVLVVELVSSYFRVVALIHGIQKLSRQLLKQLLRYLLPNFSLVWERAAQNVCIIIEGLVSD